MKAKEIYDEWKTFWNTEECDCKLFENRGLELSCDCKFVEHCDDFCDISDGFMMMIKPIDDGNSNFDLVEQKETLGSRRKTPHCKKHGAMNKVSKFKEGSGGYWRCSASKVSGCRAGCIEIAI